MFNCDMIRHEKMELKLKERHRLDIKNWGMHDGLSLKEQCGMHIVEARHHESKHLKILVAKAVLAKKSGLSKDWTEVYVDFSPSMKFWRVMDGPNEHSSRTVIENLDEHGHSSLHGIGTAWRSPQDCMALQRENLALVDLSDNALDKFLDLLLFEGRTWVQVKSRLFALKDKTGTWIRSICSRSLEDACSQAGCCLEEILVENDIDG